MAAFSWSARTVCMYVRVCMAYRFSKLSVKEYKIPTNVYELESLDEKYQNKTGLRSKPYRNPKSLMIFKKECQKKLS